MDPHKTYIFNGRPFMTAIVLLIVAPSSFQSGQQGPHHFSPDQPMD